MNESNRDIDQRKFQTFKHLHLESGHLEDISSIPTIVPLKLLLGNSTISCLTKTLQLENKYNPQQDDTSIQESAHPRISF